MMNTRLFVLLVLCVFRFSSYSQNKPILRILLVDPKTDKQISDQGDFSLEITSETHDYGGNQLFNGRLEKEIRGGGIHSILVEPTGELFYKYESIDTVIVIEEDDLKTTTILKLPLIPIQYYIDEALTIQNSFDFGFSNTVITREEIIESGVTSLQELFRLVPGMIVRQVTNGNYDIHIRGFDNLPPNGLLSDFANTSTLVMVDNRIVYNYMDGGTFWETLPVALNDIRQINVIRGPASAFYGSNAATGVINIVTRTPPKGITFDISPQIGTGVVKEGDLNVLRGTTLNIDSRVSWLNNAETFGVKVNGAYTDRNRFQDTYYSYWTNQYEPAFSDSIRFVTQNIVFPDSNFIDPNLAHKSGFINGGVYLNIDSKFNLDLNAGYQNSQVNTAFFENTSTPLLHRFSESYYTNLNSNFSNLIEINTSYRTGEQRLYPNTNRARYNMRVFHFRGEINLTNGITNLFNINMNKFLNLSLGYNRQYSSNDGTDFIDDNKGRGFFNLQRNITSNGFYGRIDANLLTTNNKPVLILTLGGRTERYNAPNRRYNSGQISLNYKPSNDKILRVLLGNANKGASYIDLFLDLDDGQSGQSPVVIEYRGNANLELQRIRTFEIGYRNKLFNENSFVDFEVFNNSTTDLSQIVIDNSVGGIDSLGSIRGRINIENLDIVGDQLGFTGQINLQVQKFKINTFVTIQKTDIKNDISERVITWTPDFYGGANITWKPVENLLFNSSLYYIGNQAYKHFYSPVIALQPKSILNFKVEYLLSKDDKWSGTRFFLKLNNVVWGTNPREPEFGLTDSTFPIVLFGTNIGFSNLSTR